MLCLPSIFPIAPVHLSPTLNFNHQSITTVGFLACRTGAPIRQLQGSSLTSARPRTNWLAATPKAFVNETDSSLMLLLVQLDTQSVACVSDVDHGHLSVAVDFAFLLSKLSGVQVLSGFVYLAAVVIVVEQEGIWITGFIVLRSSRTDKGLAESQEHSPVPRLEDL